MGSNFKILLVAGIIIMFSGIAFAADQQMPRLITVTGDAEVRVIPDEGYPHSWRGNME